MRWCFNKRGRRRRKGGGKERERKEKRRGRKKRNIMDGTLTMDIGGSGGYLVDHVTLGMPVLILAIAIDLDKLFEDGGFASSTPGGVMDRVVVVAIDLVVVLIVGILGTKDG